MEMYFIHKLHQLLLVENGLRYYFGGINQQIKNCHILIDEVGGAAVKDKLIELEKFLLAVACLAELECDE